MQISAKKISTEQVEVEVDPVEVLRSLRERVFDQYGIGRLDKIENGAYVEIDWIKSKPHEPYVYIPMADRALPTPEQVLVFEAFESVLALVKELK